MTEAAIENGLLHVTDIHFWEIVTNPLKLMNKRVLGNLNVLIRRRHEYDTSRTAAYSDALAATGVKTVLLGGDLTSTATDAEFRMAVRFAEGLAERGLRVLALPGNHDVYTFESVRKRRFERHFGPFLPPEGFPCRMSLPGGTPLVLVPTVCPNLLSSRGRIRDADVRETARLIVGSPPGPVLVAGHYPVLDATYGYSTSPTRRLPNAAALRGALGKSGRTVLYIAGHVHRFSYVQDDTYPNLRHLTTSAFFMHRRQDGSRGAFSEVYVTGGRFAVYQHECREEWDRTNVNPTLGR